ncbi:MAG: DUF547 domain-containing protein, partial [Planctomycetota bacterium]|nr:DUF547 domain-containing protein [Planctomycetota bacterium]
TLNILENDRIRPLGDPRTHAALVCAATSCPPLMAVPYFGPKIDEQLDAQCRLWVNDSQRNRVEDGKLLLSEIFKWYGVDFEVEPYGGVVGFVKTYATPGSDLASFLDSNPDPEIEWLTYDWTLNRASANTVDSNRSGQ